MTAPEADLTGWTASPFTAEGITHDVYRKGSGPGVVLIPEIPGLTPQVLALGNYLVNNGFRVASPSLFGEPARPILFCLNRVKSADQSSVIPSSIPSSRARRRTAGEASGRSSATRVEKAGRTATS